MDVTSLSEELVRMTVTKTPQFCLVLKPLLTMQECHKIIERAEEVGFKPLDKRSFKISYRKGKRVILKDELDKWLLKKIDSVCPKTLFTANNVEYTLSSVNNEVKILKYQSGDHFLGVHCDETYLDKSNSNNGKTKKSMLTIAIYLNEGYGGGQLEFSTHNKAKSVVVGAKQGVGVLFNQTIPHYAGVVGGIKYLLRADVMYER